MVAARDIHTRSITQIRPTVNGIAQRQIGTSTQILEIYTHLLAYSCISESARAHLLVAVPVANLALTNPHSVTIVATVALDDVHTGQREAHTSDNQSCSLEVGYHTRQQDILHLRHALCQCCVGCSRQIATPVALRRSQLWPVGVSCKDNAKYQLVALTDISKLVAGYLYSLTLVPVNNLRTNPNVSCIRRQCCQHQKRH